MRKIEFANNEFYHIYNRGTDKRKIFLNESDYRRFLLSLKLMNFEKDGLMQRWRDYKETNPSADLEIFLRSDLGGAPRSDLRPLVDICCYSLLPNHYHLILRQSKENGITEFIRKISTGYTMYFNKKYDRSGVLFQGKFKATLIKATHHLQYLSAYVNCNSEVHGIAPAESYHWSSFAEYVGKEENGLCAVGKKFIIENFKNGKDYEEYAKENARHFREKKLDEKLLLE